VTKPYDSPTRDMKLQVSDAASFLRQLRSGSVDMIITSPPYFMGKEYDRSAKLEDFEADNRNILPLLISSLKPGGSLCWQVGNYVKNGRVVPLDAIVYNIFAASGELQLRNRIVWTFGHGAHSSKRFSGRHETILWFTKGDNYYFNLDAVRVPQKYPGKKHYKGPRKGEWSGNPAGKNPSDVWDIPNVKSNHVEKTSHPCQFPVALVQRCIRAFTADRGLVVDPFMGSGSTAVACVVEKRQFAGCDIEKRYVEIAKARVKLVSSGTSSYRPLGKPIEELPRTHSVAKIPPHFGVS
jgi:adenine-specific DNA-methyltransferase